MNIKILSSYHGEAFKEVTKLLIDMGHDIDTRRAFVVDLVICPDYDVLLTEDELNEPQIGVLVFHPSPLPRMRGKDAIKRQYKAGDKVGGGTWFWATSGIDNGDICEQEITIIDHSIRPRDYYTDKIIPLMVRTLERALTGISKGNIRRVGQHINNEYTTKCER